MTQVNLFMLPDVAPVPWKEFIKRYPNNSIALDGFVSDETKFYKPKKIINFNHHEKVNRLATRATCAQIRLFSPLNLMDFFRDESGKIKFNVYLNDCDEDCCLSYFQLKYAFFPEKVEQPILNKLVEIEDKLDTTSGVYPYSKDSQTMREMAWIFQPYRIARLNGHLHSKNAEVYENVLKAVEQRIMACFLNKGEEIDIDTRYNILGGGKTWSMVEEIGAYGRTGMMSDGIKAYVAVSDRGNGSWSYVLGKVSTLIDFDVEMLFDKLNEIEGLKSSNDKWGGSDTIGGSPRVLGSKIPPKELEKIINKLTI